MSDVTTRAAPGDGRRVRVFYNNGNGAELPALNADDHDALATLKHEIKAAPAGLLSG
jgi:hypothetical protein